jgi:hypothetical protein
MNPPVTLKEQSCGITLHHPRFLMSVSGKDGTWSLFDLNLPGTDKTLQDTTVSASILMNQISISVDSCVLAVKECRFLHHLS